MKKQIDQYSFKKDRYAKVRGGNSHFINIYCSKCNSYILLYQKDGLGALIRLYLDRIFEPPVLAKLQYECNDKKEIPNLTCPKCANLLAIPMVYKPENRLAFSLIRGSTIKKIFNKFGGRK